MSEYQQLSEGSTRGLLFHLVMILFWTRQLTQYLWEARAVSWLLLGGGFFITTNVFIEAAANTQTGQSISGWWWRIGKVCHLLIILLLFAVFLWMIVFLATGDHSSFSRVSSLV
ncbi:hypothetical protein ACFQL7_24665 [Halocatena marina]|uniref:Uncharacterized protein n=1 Tax=Halocatena marina TaxID=2934937 RepID=A0ABD5YTX7_9EURY